MRIAIYHNDPFEAYALAQGLRQAGHRVFVKGSRYDLVTLLDHCTMDLVVTEWHGMLGRDELSGHWLIREARNAAVIFTTSDASVPDVEAGADGYRVAFLRLPAAPELIVFEVNAMIERAYPWQTRARVDVAPYSLDLIQRTIHCASELLPAMNDATFRLAYCLLVNAGRRLSRDYLIEFVGGAVATSHGRYIDTLIGVVRKILLSRTRTGLRIKSIYGFGYILEFEQGKNAEKSATLVKAPVNKAPSMLMETQWKRLA